MLHSPVCRKAFIPTSPRSATWHAAKLRLTLCNEAIGFGSGVSLGLVGEQPFGFEAPQPSRTSGALRAKAEGVPAFAACAERRA